MSRPLIRALHPSNAKFKNAPGDLRRWRILNRLQRTLVAAVFSAASFCAVAARAQTIDPFYASEYTITDLGAVPGVPEYYGALTFKSGDPQTILIGGNAERSTAGIYQVAVVRNSEGHIAGFSGMATKFANAPGELADAGIDGGLAYGPDNVLFYTTYSDNRCVQIKPGSMNPDRFIDLTQLGVASTTGGLGFVPTGFAGAGRIKFTSYSTGKWYDAAVAPNAAGTFDIIGLSQQAALPDHGPQGFAYLKAGHPHFTADSLIVAEYPVDLIVTYEINANGDPIVSTRRVLAEVVDAEGCAFDPVTGDLLVSTYDDDRVFRIQGFLAPAAEPSSCGACGAGMAMMMPAMLTLLFVSRRRQNGKRG